MTVGRRVQPASRLQAGVNGAEAVDGRPGQKSAVRGPKAGNRQSRLTALTRSSTGRTQGQRPAGGPGRPRGWRETSTPLCWVTGQSYNRDRVVRLIEMDCLSGKTVGGSGAGCSAQRCDRRGDQRIGTTQSESKPSRAIKQNRKPRGNLKNGPQGRKGSFPRRWGLPVRRRGRALTGGLGPGPG